MVAYGIIYAVKPKFILILVRFRQAFVYGKSTD